MKEVRLSPDVFVKRTLSVLCHLVLLFWSIQPGYAQSNIDKHTLIDKITERGFENVIITTKDTTLIVGYENRRFRFEPKGLHEVISIINNNLHQPVHLNLIISHQKIPLLYVDIHLADFRNFISGTTTIQDLANSLFFSSENPTLTDFSGNAANPSNFKADFVILPDFRAQFGNFDRPVQSNISLIPELNMLLAKGLSLKTQVIFPVQNNFFIDDEGREIRPGLLTINQLLRLDDNVFFQATAGFFSANRLGANIEFKKYLADGNIAFGSQLGFTAYHAFVEKRIENFESDSYFTGLLSIEYRHTPYDVIGRFQAGNFLYNDLAVRFDILRQFGEVHLGFFALLSSSSELNGGFNFAIPLPPGKYLKPGFARLRQASHFSWEYRAKGFTKNGTFYKTGHNLFETMLDYNPDYLKKRFLIELL